MGPPPPDFAPVPRPLLPRRPPFARWAPHLGLALALLCCASACGDASPADFRYEPPAGWRVLEPEAAGSSFAVAAGPERNGVVPTIRVERGTSTSDLARAVDAALAELRAQLGGLRLLARRAEPRAGGRPAERLVWLVSDEGRSLRVEQLVLLHGRSSFVVTCTRAEGEDPATDAAFEAALQSFVTSAGERRP